MINWVVPCLLLASIFLPGTLSLSCIPKVCPHSHKPNYVCGTNGDTYLSECHLARDICVKKILGLHLGKAYSGACKTQYPVRCPQCANEPYSSAVCGSDQVTYSSKCKLEAAKCNTQKYVEVDHLGPCQGSDIGGSHHGGSEIGGSHIGGSQGGSQGGSSHQAHCYQTCSYGGPNVCGSNGRTYLNWCELQKASCHIPGLTVYHQGRCDNYGGNQGMGGTGGVSGIVGGPGSVGGQYCHPHVHCAAYGTPVCASDGRKYQNICWLKKAACMNLYLTQVHCRVHSGHGTIGVHSGVHPGLGSTGVHSGVHPGLVGSTGVHPGLGSTGGVHPGLVSTGVHSGVHPGLVGSTGVHPGLGSTGGVHPGLGSTGVHSGVHPGLVGSTGVHTGHGNTGVHGGVHPGLGSTGGVHPGLGSTGGVHPGLGSTGGVYPGLVSTGVVHGGVHTGDYLNSPPNLRQKKEEEKKEEKEEEEKEEEEEKYNKETVITFKPKISPNP